MDILSILECVVLFIAAGTGTVRYKSLSPAFKLLAWSAIAAFTLAVIADASTLLYRTNALVLHIVCITQYLFYSSVYYHLFKSRLIKKTIVISIFLISVLFFINGIFFQLFNKDFPTNIYIPTQILYVVFSLLLFKEMLMYPVKLNIIKQSVFWYNTAMLFYGTTMFFNLGISNYLATRNLNDDFIFIFWYLIIYIFNILICIAFITENQKKL